MKYTLSDRRETILETVSLLCPDIPSDKLEDKFTQFNKNYGGKATSEQIYDNFIFEVLFEEEVLVCIDWKWEFEDILYELKDISKSENVELSYQVQEELHDEETGSVKGKVTANGKTYEFEEIYRTGFIEDVMNVILSDNDIPVRLHIIDQYRGDNECYAVVSEDAHEKLTGHEFLPFGV